MQTVPKFITYDDNNTLDGVFDWGKSRDEIIDLYYDASDRYNMGKTKDAKETLLNIIDRDPHFIDAYNLLGTIEAELGNPDKGLKLQKKALVIGEKIIPDSSSVRLRIFFISVSICIPVN